MAEDIENKKKKFLDCLEKYARDERVGQLFSLVRDWFNAHAIDDNGISDIEIVFPYGDDMGDGIFNAMYNVELDLKCGTCMRTMKYRYEPKNIDGVVYVAQNNPLDVHWRVNIGRIESDKSENEKKDANEV